MAPVKAKRRPSRTASNANKPTIDYASIVATWEPLNQADRDALTTIFSGAS